MCYLSGTSAGSAWTAQQSDFEQQLMIDLGTVRNVTRIEIQGRPHSNEYVTEFSISYGFNGQDYIDYKEPGGNTKVTMALKPFLFPGRRQQRMNHHPSSCSIHTLPLHNFL